MKNFLIALLLLVASNISAQIKIGDISIDPWLAQAYFYDCYVNPDTVFIASKFSESQFEMNFKDRITEAPIDRPMWPVRFGGAVAPYGATGHRIFETHQKYGDEYYVPRRPSASDFAKWFIVYTGHKLPKGKK